MIVKKINIDGKPVKFGVSARTPRLYRERYGRDVMYDMASLYNNFKKVLEAHKAANFSELDIQTQLSVIDLEMFENIAYIMAKQADPEVPDNEGDWLDQFGAFDVYEVLPELMNIWELNKKGMSVPKKK